MLVLAGEKVHLPIAPGHLGQACVAVVLVAGQPNLEEVHQQWP